VQATFGGGVSDAFVTELTANGSALSYSTYLGGTLPDVATAVAEVGGAAIVAGYTSSFNFPTAFAEQATLAGNSDAFVSRLSAGGGSLDYSTYLGGSSADSASSLVVDQNNYVYLGGQTASANFPLEAPLAGQTSRRGSSDGFVAALTSGGSRVWSSYLGGGSTDSVVGVALGSPTTLHVLGSTLSTDIPIAGVPLFATAPGPQDGFVARLTTLSPTPAPAGSARSTVLLALLLLGGAWGARTFLRPARA
jgi:Beta-propeller repeat